jgi:hypothetical protein
MLVRNTDRTEILTHHLRMLNVYLDTAFNLDFVPNRNGFFRYCTRYCAAAGIRLPRIDLTPDADLNGATVAAGDAAALDNEIFWRKVFDLERSRGDHQLVTLPRHLDLQHSLLVAARLFRSIRNGYTTDTGDTYWTGHRVPQPGIEEIVRVGPEEHQIRIEIPFGRLQIHSEPMTGMSFKVKQTWPGQRG